MAEELIISAGSKEEKYRELLPQIEAVVEDETDLIANMANIASMLHETFGFWWTGFYRVHPPLGGTGGKLFDSRSLPRSPCLYTHQERRRCVWHSMGAGRNRHRARCRSLPWSHCLFQPQP